MGQRRNNMNRTAYRILNNIPPPSRFEPTDKKSGELILTSRGWVVQP